MYFNQSAQFIWKTRAPRVIYWQPFIMSWKVKLYRRNHFNLAQTCYHNTSRLERSRFELLLLLLRANWISFANMRKIRLNIHDTLFKWSMLICNDYRDFFWMFTRLGLNKFERNIIESTWLIKPLILFSTDWRSHMGVFFLSR